MIFCWIIADNNFFSSYLHCEWKTKNEVEDKRFDQKLKRYLAKCTSKDGQLIYPEVVFFNDSLFLLLIAYPKCKENAVSQNDHCLSYKITL